jgi:sodium/bile acid cotransporter 7
MVVVATVLPARGTASTDVSLATKLVIALMFFLQGARLSREAVVAGLLHWRLHLLILAATFALFPLLGLVATRALPAAFLPPTLATGVLFLCLLPSTVQSSIAFTAVARGNVAAAVVAASASNFVGIVATPLLATLFFRAHNGGSPLGQAEAVALQLLAPFIAGQVAGIWIAPFVKRHSRFASLVDRGSILLVVYSAFSDAVVQGLWSKVTALQIGLVALFCLALLGAVLAITAFASRRLGFDKADEIAIVFCGSKKSLASGVPMASILFPAASVGIIVLPLMLFHQLQLMACAVIAQRYAARPAVEPSPAPAPVG